MPDTKYQQDTNRFDCLGLDLNRPVDSVKPQKYPLLQNVRAFQAGRIEPRDGLSDTGAGPGGAMHSARRLNDPADGTWTRVTGEGPNLAMGQSGPYGLVDTGYSGNPLALVPYRPDQSPTSFMYVADQQRMRKVSTAAAVHTIGLPPPKFPCGAEVDRPLYRLVDPSFMLSPAYGTGGAPNFVGPTLPTGLFYEDRIPANNPGPASVTISVLVWDTGVSAPGWATIVLSVMTQASLGKGMMLWINRGGGAEEFATVHEVFPGDTTTSVQIGSIIYDSIAGPGAASMVLAAPLALIQQNCLLHNTTNGEYTRVLAVTGGPDQTISLRIQTSNTWAAGDSVAVVPALRLYLVNNHTLGADIVQSPIVGATFHKGTGSMFTAIAAPPAVDLTKLGTSVSPFSAGTIPVRIEDFMHIGIIVDHPDRITEIQVQAFVDAPGVTDPTAQNQNYYYRAFRAADLTPNVLQQQPILTTSGTIIQNQQLQNPQAPDVTSQELLPGNDQWVDLIFRMGDLLRVGADQTRTWQSVVKLQFTVTATADAVIFFNSWWIGGGYTPDTFDATANNYKYRYRARVYSTGVKSNWSPAMIDSVDPERTQVIITNIPQYQPPAGTTLTTGDFVLDIQRYGGEIDQWHYLATIDNSATPTFTDNLADDTVAVLPAEEMDSWQPWPTIGLPVASSGNTALVSGITVYDPTAPFNLSWAPGTEITIAGVTYTLYLVVTTAMLFLVENAGSSTGTKWRIDEPVLMGQNLPCLWGDEQLGAMFACGDPFNPGRLYFSNGNDPDTTTETNYLDITSPSEPLQNGVMYNLRSYVFSSERMFQILPTGNENEPWRAEEIPNGKGLFSRWAITRNPAPIICFLSKDGINATTGGAPQPLTDADLYELFPNEGNLGVQVNTINPPNIVAAQAANLRLDYYDEYLYFDFVDTVGNRATLVLAFDLGAITRGEAPGGWFYDVYTPGLVFHYGEEGAGVHALLCGGVDGHLYQYEANVSDNGSTIFCFVRTGARDQGDPRSNKLYGDVMVDADTKGVDVLCTPSFNNYQQNAPGVVFNTGGTGRQQTSIPTGTQWTEARNIGLGLSFDVTGAARPLLYIWEPRYTFSSTPISTTSPPGVQSAGWSMSASSLGLENWKHIGLVRIAHNSTSPPVLNLVYDGVAAPPISVPASGGVLTQTIFRIPVQKFKLIQASINGTGGNFSLDTRDTYFDIKEWGSDGEYRGFRLFGDFSMVEG